MGEYKEIEGQIARIEAAYMAFLGEGSPKFARGEFNVSIGTGFDAESPGKHSFWARIGDWIEHRPTLAGALLAIEHKLSIELDDRIAELRRFEGLRATLKLPEIKIGGDT